MNTPTLVGRTPESGEPMAPLPRWPDAADEGPGIRCAACGTVRTTGELLRVRDRVGVRPDAAVCRQSVTPSCLGWAGRASRTSIEFYDAAAAKRWDREFGERDRHRQRALGRGQYESTVTWRTSP